MDSAANGYKEAAQASHKVVEAVPQRLFLLCGM